MKSFFFLSLLLCFSLITPSYAQDNVPVRLGERDGYARLTLGWLEKTTYVLSKSIGDDGRAQLSIKFDRDAKVDLSKIDFSIIHNIASIKIISTTPLELAIIAPKSSKVRDFKIGKRVVIDIYDPTDKEDAASFKQPPKPKPVHKAKPKIAKVVLKKPVTKKPVVKEVIASPVPTPEFVLVPDNTAAISHKKKHKKAEPVIVEKHTAEKLENAVENTHHVVAFRSTSSLDLAVFENFGELWMVIGDIDSHAIPTLSSPEYNTFSKINKIQSDVASLYKMSLPVISMHMKPKGGELVWDLIMGDKVKQYPQAHIVNHLSPDALFIPLENAAEIIDINNPVTGLVLKVVTVNHSVEQMIGASSYVDFEILRSPIGLTIMPKVDDLEIIKVDGGIEITRTHGGLSLSSTKSLRESGIFLNEALKDQNRKKNSSNSARNNFFNFSEWQMGSTSDLKANENILLSGMVEKSKERRVEDLLSLGKMFVSHGRGAEALGYFNYAGSELRELNDSAEFMALSGVSKALDWKSDAALQDFHHKDLKNIDEIKYWKSYVLADLGDWQQAAKILPDNYKPIYDYPNNIGRRLALVLAEVNLRDGKVKKAEELFALIEHNDDDLLASQKAFFKYLRGEAARQNGKIEETEEIWEALTKDKDDLYRTKAGLALTILLANNHKIDNKQAIDRLERLRYAWRGDQLEAQVNYWLGDAYFKNEEYIKGLYIMRDAASVAGDSNLGQRIAERMAKIFSDLFLEKRLEHISPVDAVALYEQFSELTPIGGDGNKIVQILAEHLVEADLLGRASKLLRYQVDHRLKGEEKMRVAIRLAAIELMDKRPQKTIEALGKASDVLKLMSNKKEVAKRKREIALLRVRAYHENKQYDKALYLLKKIPASEDVNRLRADITWNAGFWKEAAFALDEVIMDENISMTRPLSNEQADLILNRAIALSLSDDRISLANLREKYSDLMMQTNKMNQFDVITRPIHKSSLADRETLLSIVSEVDLFKRFLEGYAK